MHAVFLTYTAHATHVKILWTHTTHTKKHLRETQESVRGEKSKSK